MDPRFFEQPILNSPYEYPSRHWELDASGQPTNKIRDKRRKVAFITPIPKPKKSGAGQGKMVFDEAAQALGTEAQQYDLTAFIGGVRQRVDRWRELPDPGSWQVTPETARLLKHWRSHRFGDTTIFARSRSRSMSFGTSPTRTTGGSGWRGRSRWRACRRIACWRSTKTTSSSTAAEPRADYGPQQDFAGMILEQLATAGVQQAHKEDRLAFAAVTPWPGGYICAEGRYREGDGDSGPEKRAGIFVGPEFGTVSRPDLVAAAPEAGDAGFDVLIACAFNYEAHASEFNRLGRIPVLKARMNADLHMADELKNTGKGNLFVIFGEPDIDILPTDGDDAGSTRIQVKINGVDVFHPTTGEVRSDGADGIACWFIDTDYNEESFFVRHAYFLGANDPYKALRTTLKAEIDADAWATLHSDLSRPFDRPESGRIAVKVINHLGDEVMKVFRV